MSGVWASSGILIQYLTIFRKNTILGENSRKSLSVFKKSIFDECENDKIKLSTLKCKYTFASYTTPWAFGHGEISKLKVDKNIDDNIKQRC